MSVVGKLFTKILNKRLIKWANDHNAQHGEQAGYKKDYSTIDNIFVLQSIIQNIQAGKKVDIRFCLLTFRRRSILFHMLFYQFMV